MGLYKRRQLHQSGCVLSIRHIVCFIAHPLMMKCLLLATHSVCRCPPLLVLCGTRRSASSYPPRLSLSPIGRPLWHTTMKWLQPPTASVVVPHCSFSSCLVDKLGVDTNIIYLLTYAKLCRETAAALVARTILIRLTETSEQFMKFEQYWRTNWRRSGDNGGNNSTTIKL